MPRPARPLPARATLPPGLRPLARFARGEAGSMTVFGLFTFVLMLIVGGMAVDMMRHETSRTRLQATLDRAVLAAGDLEVARADAEPIVRSHFRAAGLEDQLTDVSVVEGLGMRRVSARAEFDINTHFMRLVGVDELDGAAAGTAEESMAHIEVVLVLDVSGSMVANGVQRLANLKAAAHEFVNLVLSADTENRISIAIVPFNGQVNLGVPLRSQYNVTDVVTSPANVNCIDLPTTAYGQQTISQLAPMPATAYADTFSSTHTSSNAYAPWGPETTPPASTWGRTNPANVWCPPVAGNVVTLPTRNATTLHNAINALEGIGATSINAGMRWGMTMMDPGARPMFASLVGGGHMAAGMLGRPFDYRQSNTAKFLILMTDGEHFAEERMNGMNGQYRSGTSPIWRSAADGNYSINLMGTTQGSPPVVVHPAGQPYWVPHRNAWQWQPWTGAAPPAVPNACNNNNDLATDPNGHGPCVRTLVTGAAQQTWPEVWARLRVRWVAFQLYARPICGGCGAQQAIWVDIFRSQTATTVMDTQLQQMCTRARNEGVTVYGVAFEAPAGGQTQIRNCSTTPAHYAAVWGAEIRAVFAGIAAQINSLRLTQ